MEVFLGALLILIMRMADVSIGTFRTILVVQAKKYYAAIAGFIEVLIWIFAMRYIVDHMDNTLNLFAYAAGFSIGNLLGITLEEKIISATKSMEKLIDKYCSLKKTHERHVVYSSGLIGVMLGVLVYLFFF